MKDRELMQMALDALESIERLTDGAWQDPFAEERKALRDRLAQPEPTGREIQKMMQSAWKAVQNQYKDDPECCFALGWEAGYGAVAPRVEPPETESGEWFESIPAPSIKQPEPEPVAQLWECLGKWSAYLASHGDEAELAPPQWLCDAIKAATAPPKREWVELTEQDVHDAFKFTELIKQLSFDRDRPEWCENFAAYIEAKLKEKNCGV